MTFKDGATTLGSASLTAIPNTSSAHAPLVTSSLTPGFHYVTANYAGNGNYLPSSSGDIEVIVTEQPVVNSVSACLSSDCSFAINSAQAFTATEFTPGEVVTIFGSVGYCTLTVDGQPVWSFDLTDDQANIQLPVGLAAGSRNLVCTSNTGLATSNPFFLTIVPYAPLIMLNSSAGWITHLDGTLVSSSNPAVPGERLDVYALGLGPVTNQPVTGSPGPASPLSYTTTPVTVTFGGQEINALAAYLSPTLAGVYEVQFVVPDGLVSGNLQITLSVGGQTSNSATVAYANPVALGFVPITPCRAVDTRTTARPLGGPSIPGGTSRDFVIAGNACAIPASASAYSLNVTVVPQGSLSYLTIWPTGQTRPVVSTLNSLDGRIKANAALVPAGTNGAVSVYATDTTDVVLDINGYFVPATDSSALAFYPLTPCRVADTRAAAGPGMSAGQSRAFAITGGCGVPSAAQAYSLNFTVVPKTTLGYLTVWPTGQSKPVVSTLNALTGAITANAAIVPAGTSGDLNVYATDATDLIIDVNGYFAPPATGGLSFYNLSPCRALDTRNPAGSQPIAAKLDVDVTSSGCGAPATAEAYVFNATVIPPAPLGYISLWPQGEAQPVVSTLNAFDGAITSNMAIVPTTNGSISVFPSSATHLILDIAGYFAP